jgi:opacity protein-like surface antigen
MYSRTVVALVTSAVLCLVVPAAEAQDRWRRDIETGAAISGYNDVRIPGDTGTLFSFTDDLGSETAYFWRVRADVRLAPKHVLSALIAPLTINSAGSFDQPVSFAGATFAPGVPVKGLYVFNSYRVTYRYEPVRRENWMFGVGVTLKVRDAETRLEAGGTSAAKTNVGIVPLVSFTFERRLGARATVLLEGDALAAPQGRAEDIFAGLLVRASRQLSIKAGYRFLEGGADNEEVYTFALVHYLAAGVVVRF